MRLNFGCGKTVLEGWHNVDAVSREGAEPDLIYAMEFDPVGALIQRMPLDDGCAEVVMALHVIEHVHAWEAPAALAEWKRVLAPGGKLVLELPNIELAARNLLEGMPDNMTMFAFYGDASHRDPWMMHKYGYTSRTITDLVRRAGFSDVIVKSPKTHAKRVGRDMRVEAIKRGHV